MPSDQTVDFVVMFLTVGLIVLGLLSFLIGWVVRTWDRIMSRYAAVPVAEENTREHGSYAAEPFAELTRTVGAELVPYLAELLSDLDDDQVLEVLARVTDSDGDPRYAESTIAKFIPGRVADRLDQVRAVRGTAPPPPVGRVLKIRDSAGERLIPY